MLDERLLLRLPSRKACVWSMMYLTDRPWMLADSGLPPPCTRWHCMQARTLGALPMETILGTGPCSLGNQSGGAFGLLICVMVSFIVTGAPAAVKVLPDSLILGSG